MSFLLLVLSGGAAQATAVAPATPAALPASHQFIMAAKASGREFIIQVAEPVRPPRPGERTAVVYVLDGDYTFGLATDIARALQIMGEMAPAYVVAIGYPGDDLGGWVKGRLHDLNHREVDLFGEKVGGGGGAFQSFLLQELRLLIEARYPIDSGRAVLAGHSLGGQFAAQVLLNRSDSFAGYVIGSPSLWIVPQIIAEAKAEAKRPGPRAKVYVGAGSEEKNENLALMAEELAMTLKTSDRFDVSHRTFDKEGHITVAGSLLAHGLKFVLPPPRRRAPAPSG